MRLALVSCQNLPDWEVDDRPLHEALRARGAEVLQPAWDDPAVDWRLFDALLLRTPWDYQEHCDRFVDWAERVGSQTPLFHDAEIVRWNTHKSYLHDLAQRGIPVTTSAWLSRGTRVDLKELLETRRWKEACAKPMVGATARETLPIRDSEEDRAQGQLHLDRLLAKEDMIVQPLMHSVFEEGELSALFIDGEFTHGVRKVPVKGDYRVQDDFGAHDEPFAFEDEDIDLARRTLSTCGQVLGRKPDSLLYGRVDFLRDAEGALCINEVELVEPSLFFRHGAHAAEALAAALIARL